MHHRLSLLARAFVTISLACVVGACGGSPGNGGDGGGGDSAGGNGGSTAMGGMGSGAGGAGGSGGSAPVYADIEAVSFGGSNLNYYVGVTIRSPDAGCDQYADWWEIVTADGDLVYRVVFDGPHVGQETFTDDQAGVPIETNVNYLYRAHMHPWGYGGTYLFRTQTGTTTDPNPPDFSGQFYDLEDLDPQPPPCVE